jgi:hypothetical protein
LPGKGLHYTEASAKASKYGIPHSEEEVVAHLKVKQKFLDALLSNLSSRLEEPALVANLSVLNLQAVDADCRTLHGFEDLTALANNFGLDVDEVQDEWMRFKDLILEGECCLDRSIQGLTKFLSTTPSIKPVYKGLSMLYGVAATTPISTAEVERLFSAIKLLYTDHRARLNVATADKLLMIKLNSPTVFPYQEAASNWCQLKKRRL